jgi:hypothetical protein
MNCLNPPAHKLLLAEVERQFKSQKIEIQRDIVVKRLNNLANQQGTPASYVQLEGEITDIFPDFDPEVLKNAAKANSLAKTSTNSPKSRILPKIALIGGIVATGLVGLSGLVWLVNLPYPMIRRPVAKVAPLLLLPSYLSMDRNYREAIAHVEQADQLVNKATSAADIDLGSQKVKLAQANLDQLPVWFLGYEPVMLCQYMGCSWHFTFDEFAQARAQIGRMEARVFQETNALNDLKIADNGIQSAKQSYQSAPTPPQKQAAIANWKTHLDRLAQLPPNTLAGGMAVGKLASYKPEFEQIAGQIAGSTQTQTLIAVAQQYSSRAVALGKKNALTVAQWKQVETLWNNAIDRLNKVSETNPDYLAAQTHLANYVQQLGNIQTRKEEEAESLQILGKAKQQIQLLLSSQSAQPSRENQNQTTIQLQEIIDQLTQVKPHTTAYEQAQTLLKQAQAKLAEY